MGLTDRVRDPIGGVGVRGLHDGMQELAVLGEVQKRRGQVHYGLFGRGDLGAGPVEGQAADRQVLGEALGRRNSLRYGDSELPDLRQEGGERILQHSARVQKGSLRGHPQVRLDGEQPVRRQELENVLQDVADVGEELDRRGELPQRVPAAVLLCPVGIEKLFDPGGLQMQGAEQRPGEAVSAGRCGVHVQRQSNQVSRPIADEHAELLVRNDSLHRLPHTPLRVKVNRWRGLFKSGDRERQPEAVAGRRTLGSGSGVWYTLPADRRRGA